MDGTVQLQQFNQQNKIYNHIFIRYLQVNGKERWSKVMDKCKTVFLWVECATFATDHSQIQDEVMQLQY
jgi:hypothetical protein